MWDFGFCILVYKYLEVEGRIRVSKSIFSFRKYNIKFNIMWKLGEGLEINDTNYFFYLLVMSFSYLEDIKF